MTVLFSYSCTTIKHFAIEAIVKLSYYIILDYIRWFT